VSSFYASPSSIQQGQATKLIWGGVTNMDYVSIEPGVGYVAAAGSSAVWPIKTTTYTLTAHCGSRVATLQATVTVTPLPLVCRGAPSIVSFAASSSKGSAAPDTLSWNVSNADAVQIDQGIGKVATSGSTSISPKTTTTYTLTASCGSITTTQSVTVYVPNPSVCQGAPKIERFAVSSSLTVAVVWDTLSWKVSNADVVQIDQGIGRVPTSGSRRISPKTTTTYTLTASCGSITTTQSVTVNVPSPSVCQVKPYIERFTASPSYISVGQKSTLTWLAGPSSMIYVEIDQGIGRVATSGSWSVSPGTDTTYTLTAYCDAYTKVSRQTTVKVIWLNIVAPRSRTPVPFGFVTRIPVLPK
jgi:hypothetical protein